MRTLCGMQQYTPKASRRVCVTAGVTQAGTTFVPNIGQQRRSCLIRAALNICDRQTDDEQSAQARRPSLSEPSVRSVFYIIGLIFSCSGCSLLLKLIFPVALRSRGQAAK